MPKSKFYAVRHGREGPKVYGNWSECERNVKGFANAVHKSFPSRDMAQAWVDDDRAHVELSRSNPWSNIPNVQASDNHQPFPVSAPPEVPLDLEPFTEDFIPLPSSPDLQSVASEKSTVALSDEQENILELVKRGKNIFFTGPAGTGKSVLLREIISHFGGEVSEKLAITASTGIAGLNIGGTTLHSFAGIGLGNEDVGRLVKKILGNKKSVKRWQCTETLIIDEISMVDGRLFDKLDIIARRVRANNKPFGGIQLIVSGDFCQLPPVPERVDDVDIPVLFAFEVKSWQRCFDENPSRGPTAYRLTKVFRQKDQTFIAMLNSMRNGQLDSAASAQFYKLSRPVCYSDGLEPCELFPLREQVRKANEAQVRHLPGKPETFSAMDIGGYDIRNQRISLDRAKKLLDRGVAPEIIELKVGAQVLLIKNLVQGHLVNGSLGQVVAFQSITEARRQNTAIAEVDTSKGLRKTKRLDDGERVMNETQEISVFADRQWPVVRFTNNCRLLLTPVEFDVVNVHGYMEARRDQVPLILAWALSIHKCQGQTLERVKVDLGRVFEKGQAYVALSRATTMEGLQVLNFHPSKVMAHPRVLAWEQRLEKKSMIPLVSPTLPTTAPLDEFDEFDQNDDDEAMARYYAVAL